MYQFPLFHFSKCMVYFFVDSVEYYEKFIVELKERFIPFQGVHVGKPRGGLLEEIINNNEELYKLIFIHKGLQSQINTDLLRHLKKHSVYYYFFSSSSDVFEFIETNFDPSMTSDYIETLLRLFTEIVSVQVINRDNVKKNSLLKVTWIDSSTNLYLFKDVDISRHMKKLQNKMVYA